MQRKKEERIRSSKKEKIKIPIKCNWRKKLFDVEANFSLSFFFVVKKLCLCLLLPFFVVVYAKIAIATKKINLKCANSAHFKVQNIFAFSSLRLCFVLHYSVAEQKTSSWISVIFLLALFSLAPRACRRKGSRDVDRMEKRQRQHN